MLAKDKHDRDGEDESSSFSRFEIEIENRTQERMKDSDKNTESSRNDDIDATERLYKPPGEVIGGNEVPEETGGEAVHMTSAMQWKIAIAGSSMFASSYCLTNVFPYVGFMVVRFTGNTNEEAGYHAGILASAFMFARIPTSVVWGFLADRVGRKFVLMWGCFTMFAFQLMLGVAPSFEVAVLSRLFTGLFSGVVGTSKTIASELAGSDPAAQNLAMNIISSYSNLGVILGPAISGFLYDPATQYPESSFAQIALFRDYPYLLPNLVSSLFSLASFLGIWLLLPETLPNAVSAYSFFCSGSSKSKYSQISTSAGDEAESLCEEGCQDDDNATSQPPEEKKGEFREFLRVLRELWQRKGVRKACMMYGYYSFIAIFFTELFPLWLMAKSEVGGFAFDAKTIGGTISFSAILLLLFQILIFPSLGKIFTKPREFLRAMLVLSIFYFFLSPILGVVDWPNRTFLLVVLVIHRGIGNILNIVCFTQCNIMPNNSCGVHERATVNGLVMGIASVYKALGPLCAGFTFAWSINNGMGFPLNFSFSFSILGTLCAIAALYTYSLPEELNTMKKVVSAPLTKSQRDLEEAELLENRT
mmetsp:Transcript_17738/g.34975  ORF Transcript_17738/g.34975 Transcript_17738/m.34975 type:complete len:589 (-) Transcript_17738:202-1968(-)